MKSRRMFSLREKNGNHRRGKSEETGGHRSRLFTDAFFARFQSDAAKQAAKEEDEKEKEAAKVEDIERRLAELNITNITEDHIRYSLSSMFAEGNVDKAIEYIQMQQKAQAGEIVPYDPNVEMAGAVNRGNVTCYLDSLLFAMFSKLQAFECMLKSDFSDEPKRRLVTLLRLWVDMLRSGKLIQTDLTQLIQEALADCGWKDARLLEQQDTSEAFAFITETLQLPLLPLQVDLFHQGKTDSDDHKVVYERLLNLAVPPDPDGKGIKLEDCLEEYFNTKVDVLRDSHEEKKTAERPTGPPKSTIRIVTEADDLEPSDTTVMSPAQMTPIDGRPLPAENEQKALLADEPSSSSASRPLPRHRSTSVIQRIVVDEKGRPTSSAENSSLLQQVTRKGSTIVKAITIPAWQFFRLIPWHATSTGEGPKNDDDVAMQFKQRPVVGICLKRYMMTTNGIFRRHNTFIDIPDSMRLPHFMLADEKKLEEDPMGFSQEYKLVLQSVVCHRGDSLQSGHYVAFARVEPKLLTDNRRHDHDPPPDYEEAQWAKFDDLRLESRVSYVDDIKESLKTEMPYLLFYQIVPMVDVAYPPSTEGTETEPPSYSASNVDVTGPSTPNPSTPNPMTDPSHLGTVMSKEYFDSRSPRPPSIRFSAELERPSRLSSGDEDGSRQSRQGDSRPASVTFPDSTFVTPPVTPDVGTPAVTPGEETTSQRLSRAKARLTKSGSRSRPVSQAGDGRISTAMTRLGLSRTSKEPLRDGNGVASTTGVPSTSAALGIKDGEVLVVEPPAEGEAAQAKNRRGKSRSRTEREKIRKAGLPPERECSVM